MGIFGDEAERLLRETWASPSELAEELYAIFTSSKALDVNGPINITNAGNTAPINVKNVGGSNQLITVNHQTPSTPQFPDLPPIPPFNTGDNYFTTYYDNQPPEQFPTPPPNDQQGTGTQIITGTGGGGGIPGQVVSGGPGAGPYQVKLYLNGTSGVATLAQGQVLQLASDATVPPGTWAFFTKAPSDKVGVSLYYFQPAVWLDPPGGGGP